MTSAKHVSDDKLVATSLEEVTPVTGVVGAVPRRVLAAVKQGVARRFEARNAQYANELYKALGTNEATEIEEVFTDPRFEEVAFQNYRRAMDAIDSAVLPALARLTSMYSAKKPDSFFRGIGRVLQDLSAEELNSLKIIMLEVVRANIPIAQIVHGCSEQNTAELRIFGEKKIVHKCEAPTGSRAILDMLDRHGLSFHRETNGADLALTGRTDITIDCAGRILSLIQ